MRRTAWLLRIVGLIQIVLGIFYLFTPDFILRSMGHSLPDQDIHYPLAMLAARFIAYGAALIYIAKEPVRHRLWMHIMVLMQSIDLAAGIFYTSTGIVSLSLSGFPIFNAVWIIVLFILWMPKTKRT